MEEGIFMLVYVVHRYHLICSVLLVLCWGQKGRANKLVLNG